MENTEAERDIYDELLTQAEIQGNVNKVNGESRIHTVINRFGQLSWFPRCSRKMSTFPPTVSNALSAAEQALLSGNEDKLYEALKAMGIQNMQPQNKGWYLKQLQADRETKEQVADHCAVKC